MAGKPRQPIKAGAVTNQNSLTQPPATFCANIGRNWQFQRTCGKHAPENAQEMGA